MPQNAEVTLTPAFVPLQLSGRELYAALEAEQRSRKAHVRALSRELQAERRARALRRLAGLWPVAAGLLIGTFAPALQAIAAARAPWALTAVFPFYALASPA